MAYEDRFSLVEDYLAHLDQTMGAIADPFLQSRYLGFVVISSVTAYELAIKDIFYAFADKKHVVLGSMARSRFDQLNGRIKLDSLRKEHVGMFGSKYADRFKRIVDKRENDSLRNGDGSIKASYGNVISWRHSFVHQGWSLQRPTMRKSSEHTLRGRKLFTA